jgi:hypothetical protein
LVLPVSFGGEPTGIFYPRVFDRLRHLQSWFRQAGRDRPYGRVPLKSIRNGIARTRHPRKVPDPVVSMIRPCRKSRVRDRATIEALLSPPDSTKYGIRGVT